MAHHYVDLSKVFNLGEGKEVCTELRTLYGDWDRSRMRLREWEEGETEEMIKEYGEDLVLLDISKPPIAKCHLGLSPEIYKAFLRQGYRIAVNIMFEDLLEQARDISCTGTSRRESIQELEDKVFRINRLWMKFKDLHRPPEININGALWLERDLTLLERDAILEPWNTVQSKFSFGTLKEN